MSGNKYQAVTQLDKKSYFHFAVFDLFKGKHPKAKMRFVISLLSLITLCAVFILVSTGNLAFINLVILTLAGDLYYLFLIVIAPRRNYRINKAAIEKPALLVFSDSCLTSYETKSERLLGRINYESIKEVYETSDFWYLYTSKKKAVIVSKKGVKDNNEEKIAEVLKREIGKKYYISQY